MTDPTPKTAAEEFETLATALATELANMDTASPATIRAVITRHLRAAWNRRVSASELVEAAKAAVIHAGEEAIGDSNIATAHQGFHAAVEKAFSALSRHAAAGVGSENGMCDSPASKDVSEPTSAPAAAPKDVATNLATEKETLDLAKLLCLVFGPDESNPKRSAFIQAIGQFAKLNADAAVAPLKATIDRLTRTLGEARAYITNQTQCDREFIITAIDATLSANQREVL